MVSPNVTTSRRGGRAGQERRGFRVPAGAQGTPVAAQSPPVRQSPRLAAAAVAARSRATGSGQQLPGGLLTTQRPLVPESPPKKSWSAAVLSRTSASSVHVLSSNSRGTTAWVGEDRAHPPITPARRSLTFGPPSSKNERMTTRGNDSISSLSHTVSTMGRSASKRAPSGGKKAAPPSKKQKKNFGKRTGGDDDDEAADDDGEVDVVPITEAAAGAANDGMTEEERKMAAQVSSEMLEAHRAEFMKRAFPPNSDLESRKEGMAHQTYVATIKMCRPQKDLDYIINIVANWRPELKIREMEAGYERNRLQAFRHQHPNGTKLVKQYHIEHVAPPGSKARIVLRRIEKKKYGTIGPGRIVVSREDVFYVIDEWHRASLHMGQERTWTYCSERYYNVSKALVKHYCETCVVCMKKILSRRQQRQKPIRSQHY